MLSSNSSSCNHNQNPNYGPFSENDITSFTSINSEDPNFFFGFPNSPHMQLEYEDVYLDDFLPHFHTNAAVNMPPDGVTAAAHHQPSAAVRSRSLKKDRHSKINTARGPRDRRMRLSLDVARRFFDLQDLLRYDKASRTVDWLLKNSMSAIRDLERGSSRESCTSEDCGEAVSSASAPTKGNNRKVGKRAVVRVQLQQKRATVAKESRRKARERARERTSQKRRLTAHSQVVSMHAEDLSSDEARISGATTQGEMCDWNSFHFHHNINAEFLHQDEQIAEFQFNGKPWEGYNSFN